MKEKSSRYLPEQVAYIINIDELGPKNASILNAALSKLDKKIVDRVAKEVYFFDGHDTNGFHLPLNAEFLKSKKSLIFLSESLEKCENDEAVVEDLKPN